MSPEPEPYTLGHMVLSVQLHPDGTRQFGMNINVHGPGADTYDPTAMYDINAMLGFAHQNLTNPDWLAVAYAQDDTE